MNTIPDVKMRVAVCEDFDSKMISCDENCKQAVNELLWRFLPGSTTMKEAEALSCEIYDIISNEWLKD